MSAETRLIPSAEITRMMDGAVIAQLIYLAAELGVADLLTRRPRTVAEIAERTGTAPDPLYRMLRTLASVGIFVERPPRAFGLTPLADALRSDAPDSVRNLARIRGSQEHARTIAGLRHSLRHGRAAFDEVHGTDWWTYLGSHRDRAALFTEAMGDTAEQMHQAVADAYDFTTAGQVVDVGAGRGDLAALLLSRHPGLNVVLYDRPHALGQAESVLAAAGVRARARLVAGDFFRWVPAGGGIYVLSRILHDWNDQDASSILRTVGRVLPAGAKVVVIEAVVPDGNGPHPAKTMDIIMLAMHGGKERTESEFAALFTHAGLRHVETRCTRSDISLLVAEAG